MTRGKREDWWPGWAGPERCFEDEICTMLALQL